MSDGTRSRIGALGIIAGGGQLPIAIAQAAIDDGREVFLVGISGLASAEDLSPFPHDFAGIGEFGKFIRVLRGANCTEITFAGKVPRPKFADVKLDMRGAMALPRVVSAARGGDDALMRAILDFFEKEGFRVIGSNEAARRLLAPLGVMGAAQPSEQDKVDIAKAVAVVRAMGAHDIGQAAVVCDGVVLSVEAAEGTDAMLRRTVELPDTLRGTASARRGVLVKAPKPDQERRVDLPVIGRATLDLAKEAGLRGIAVQAEGALILHRSSLVKGADEAGMFVLGFADADYPK